jgi:hypothetical protein
MIAVSSMRVRSAHGNSFNELVGAGEQLRGSPTRPPIGRRFFEPNPLAFFGAHYPLGREKAGFYSTAPLEKTLTDPVDFALIERCLNFLGHDCPRRKLLHAWALLSAPRQRAPVR